MVDVVVVIATSMKRTSLLFERSLRSVYQQKGISPRCVYIVDDNEGEREIGKVRQCVQKLRVEIFGENAKDQNLFHTKVMRNGRTKGRSGSGSWNTAALHAYQVYGAQHRLYLALLDDDDAWHENYLQQCMREVQEKKTFVAAVVSSFIREERNKKEAVIVQQHELNQESFFIGNPGWQGSNTFVEIKTFWKAGGFDESMQSTHDRDFAIRALKVCESQGYHVAAIDRVLWTHYAHNGQRVTTGESKKQGLDLFYAKYTPVMSSEVFHRSLTRAKKLFGYEFNVPKPFESHSQLNTFRTKISKRILIGVVSASVKNIKQQLHSILQQLNREPAFYRQLHYFVMTNGGVEEQEICTLLQGYNDCGLTVECVDERAQLELIKDLPFRQCFDGESVNEKSIAFSRTLLQFKLWREAKLTKDSVVMVLDDDLLFEALVLEQDEVKIENPNFFAKLMHLSETNADIMIAKYTDAPPLPFYSSLRVQLVDMRHKLQCELKGEAVTTNIFAISDEYYYDLSSVCYEYLEKPLSIQEGKHSIVEDMRCLKKQANVYRPLLLDVYAWNQTLLGSDYHRGGIAIFNDIDALVRVPHLAPEVKIGDKKLRSRRSDFISSLFLQDCGVNIQEVCFPLRHNRKLQEPCGLGKDKVALDVFGASFYRALRKSLCKGYSSKQIQADFDNSIRTMVAILETTSLRILQLIDEIDSLLGINPSYDRNHLEEDLLLIKKAYKEGISRQQLHIIRRELQHFKVNDEIQKINEILVNY